MSTTDTPAAAAPDDKFAVIPEAGFVGRGINAFSTLFALAILLSAGILVVEVVLRYVFNAPTIWAHETVIFLTAITFIYGGLVVAARDRHIRVVLIYDLLPPGPKRMLNAAISIANALACAIFAWAAWQVVRRALWTPQGEVRLETSGSAWNPPTPGLMKLFLFFILIVMAVQFAVLAVNYLRGR